MYQQKHLAFFAIPPEEDRTEGLLLSVPNLSLYMHKQSSISYGWSFENGSGETAGSKASPRILKNAAPLRVPACK